MVDLIDKTPPQAIEAEMAVLGAMLIEREAQAKVLDILDENSFYKPAHQHIFRDDRASLRRRRPRWMWSPSANS